MTESEAKINQIYEDYNMVLEQAKSMGCNKIKGLYNIPLDIFKTIVSALEKQTPKKIVREKLRPTEMGSGCICPVCEAGQNPTEFFSIDGELIGDMFTYCWYCGQKLDWSE